MTLLLWSHGAGAAEDRVVVLYGPGARGAAQKIEQEISLNDLEVELRKGGQSDGDQLRDEPGVLAVVVVETTGATILLGGSERRDASDRQNVARASGESTDSLALRTGELLRGSLLGRSPTDSAPSNPSARSAPSPPRFSFTTGPALLLRTFAAPAPGWGGDAAVWFGRWGVGPFLGGSLTRATWTATSDEVRFGQLRVGLGGRVLLVQTKERRWDGQALLRVGLEPLSLRGTTGSERDRFEGGALFFTAECGLEASYRLSSWLRLGVQMVGGVDLALSWPQTEAGKDLPEQAQGNGANVRSPRPRPQGHMTPSAVVSAHF